MQFLSLRKENCLPYFPILHPVLTRCNPVKPWTSLPTLLTWTLSSRDSSHGDAVVQNYYWSTGCRNWAITLRQYNIIFNTSTWVTAHTIDRNINLDSCGSLFAHTLSQSFSLKSLSASRYSLTCMFTNRCPEGPHLEPGPPHADLRQAASFKVGQGLAACSLTGWKCLMADSMLLSPTL